MSMKPTRVQFSNHQLKLIEMNLPSHARPRRAKQLRQILRHWSRTELEEHLSPKPSAATQKQRNKRLLKVGQRAQKLFQAIEELDDNCRDLLAYMMASADTKVLIGEQHAEFFQLMERIDNERFFLEKLSQAAPKAVQKSTRRNIPAYLVMLDAAAIYKWLTGKKPTRVVKDGNETGPFYEFVASL
jgi:hypothetical protein